jgi:hypothetical protein
MLGLTSEQLGRPNLLTVIVLGLPGTTLLTAGFIVASSRGGEWFVVGLGTMLFGALLFVGSFAMLIAWFIKALRT